MTSHHIRFDDYVDNAELQEARNLMHAIWQIFPNGHVYIVGGVPRDMILGHPIKDVDLATNIPFEELGKHFDIQDISKNGSQPVYNINYAGFSYDLAAFRTDSGAVGRHNNVATLTDSIEEDTKRRDLTINALVLNELGDILDFHGGIDDLENGIIRCVGDPIARFQEDASRILRVLRFAARYRFRIDDQTAEAIFELGPKLLTDRGSISPEAISKEFYKAASGGVQLWRFICELRDFNLCELILPEFEALQDLRHDPQHHPEGGSTVIGHIYAALRVLDWSNPVTNLGILFHDFGKATTVGVKENGHSSYHGHEEAGVPIVERIFERLRFPDLSAQDKENILLATSRHMLIHNIGALSSKKLVRLFHHPGWQTLLDVSWSDEASRGAPLFNQDDWNEKIAAAEERARRIAPNKDALRLRLKAYIDGRVVKIWFPEETEAHPPLIGQIINECCDYIVEELDACRPVLFDKIKEVADSVVQKHKAILESL